jgi:hypothetical protein
MGQVLEQLGVSSLVRVVLESASVSFENIDPTK